MLSGTQHIRERRPRWEQLGSDTWDRGGLLATWRRQHKNKEEVKEASSYFSYISYLSCLVPASHLYFALSFLLCRLLRARCRSNKNYGEQTVAIHQKIHISISSSSAAPTFWWSFHCMRCSRCSMLPLLQPVHFHNNGQSAEDYSSRQGKFINAPNAPDATHSVLPRQKAVVIYFCIATYLLRVAPVLGLQDEQWSCVRLRCWWVDCWQFIWL